MRIGVDTGGDRRSAALAQAVALLVLLLLLRGAGRLAVPGRMM